MIHSFKDLGTEDIFNGKNTKAARRICPQNLWKVAARKLDQLDSVNSLDQLRIPPGNRLVLWLVIAKANIVFGSMTNIGYVLCGQIRDRLKLKLWITIELLTQTSLSNQITDCMGY